MTRTDRRQGFTIVEVLIAIVMLSIGVMALASTSGTITKMMYGGKSRTRATALAVSILDSLRYRAYATSPQCTNLSAGSTTRAFGAFSVVSVIGSAPRTRTVEVRVSYRVGGRAVADTVRTTLFCR